MAYLIYKSNGSAVSVPDNLINTAFYNASGGGGYGPGNVPQSGHGLGVQLVGKNKVDYGAAIAQDLLQLQENFCSATTPSDTTSLQGQLWFKQTSTTAGELYVRIAGNSSGGILNWQKIITIDNAGNSNVGTVTSGIWNATPIGIAYGGTGQTTANGALNALLPSQTGNAGKVLQTNGTNTSWSTSGTGSVTSVSVSGGSTGLTTTGGPITTTGIITLTGTLGIANGGTGQTTANNSLNALLPSQTGNAGKALITDGTNSAWTSITNGTVTSVAFSGGTTGLTVSGSPVTTSGTITLAGTLGIANGGTGQTTANGALNALLPSQTGNVGKVLQTTGLNSIWSTLGSVYFPTITFPGTSFAINSTYTLPTRTIGINVLFSTSSAFSNGAWGSVEIYTSGNVFIGKVSVFAANNPAGGDGGSGMNWRGANYIAIPTNASYVKFIRESGGNSGTFVVEQVVQLL